MANGTVRTDSFQLARPEPIRRLTDLDFRPSLAIETAVSLSAAAIPDEFNHSPRLGRILATVGEESGEARRLLGSDIEAASWTVVGAAQALESDDPAAIPDALAAAAPTDRRAAVRRFVATTWGPALAREWQQGGLAAEVADAGRRAASRLPATAEASVADLITAVTGLRPLAEQLREIGRYPGSRLVFVPSHFTDPSTGYLYGPRQCLVLFSSRRGLAEQLQQNSKAGTPDRAGRASTPGQPAVIADEAALVAALKALADPMRLHILRLVAERSMYTSELATALGLTQPAISHHVAVLKRSGLVRVARTGPYVYVHAVPARLTEVAGIVSSLTVPREQD